MPSSSSQSFFPAVLGLLFHMWLAWLLAASAAGAAVAAAGPPSSLPVPDDCVSSQFESGIELLCSLSAINSADERTNFSVIPADHTLSLTVRCREPTMSRLEADGFKSLKHLKKLTLDGCHLRSLPARAFWGLNDLRSLTIKTRNAGVLAVDSDAFLGLGLLEELDLSGNYLRELPSNALCPLRKLRTINLSKNEVKNLNDLGNSLECLKSVKSIDLSHNQLSTVDNDIITDSWPKLEDLRLNHNAIKAVLGNLLRSKSRLKFFDLSNNQLTTLPPELLADCTSLGRINLANNTIAFLPNRLFMRQSKSLQVLDLSGNNLGTLDAQLLSSLGALTSLDLSSNKLTSIDSGSFKGTKMLQSLKLSQNKLERLPLNPLPALRSLILSDNDLSRLPSRLFSKLPALSHLLLDKNNLEELPKRIFVNSSKLTVLDLSHNKLDDIPTAVNELVSLQSLAIGHNFVRSLTQLQLKSLWRLQASGNRLTNVSAIQLEGLPALQVLDLSQNKISSIEKNAFAMNKPLQAIRLDNNQLTRMDGLFHDLENLSWLNVSANQISVFDYAMIPKTLQWLDIHQNELSALENYFAIEDALQRLTHIDASFNQLKELGPGNLPNAVETVLLNDNHISSLVPYTFFKKSKLKKVDLSVNRLENIDRNSLRLSTDGSGEETDYLSMSRPKFYLGGNPVRCDCHMAWFKSINDHDANSLQSYPQVADLESIYCQLLYSRDQSFVPLVDAATDDFLCSYKTHCFALCHCCDYDACDCEMTCPDNCTCYHDTTWTKNIAECSNSEFRDLPDQLPMDATEIFLDGNDVGELHSHTFIGRKNLKVLFLNHSLISAVENHTFNGLAALEILHLEGNSISRLQGDEFHGLSSLRELYLQDNKIHIVNNATFKELKSLEIIFLQGNHLVDFQAWNLGSWNPSLNQVQLGGNPWSCECRFIQHFRSWLLEDQEESNPVVLDAHLLTCEEDTLVLKSECEPATATTHIQQQRNSVRDGIGEDGLSKTAAGLFQVILIFYPRQLFKLMK